MKLLVILLALFSVNVYADITDNNDPFDPKRTFTDINPVYNNPVKAVHKVKIRWEHKAQRNKKTDIPRYYELKCYAGSRICRYILK